MVEQVEELSPELQVHAFAEGEREVLDKGKIGVHETGPIDWGASRGAEFTERSFDKRTGVEPVLNGMDLSGAVRATRVPGPAGLFGSPT